MRHAKRRARNFVAKRLREDPKFKPKVIERKRLEDDDGDYKNLDWWLEGRDNEEPEDYYFPDERIEKE